MKVRGEMFLLINAWMNFLSLALAARVGRRRFRPGRAALASALGAAYALGSWMGGGGWRGAVPLLLAALLMAWVAFGRAAWRLAPLTLGGGLLLSGGADYLIKKGAGGGQVLLLCAGLTLIICFFVRRRGPPGLGDVTLRLALEGRWAAVPAIRDSGNLLRSGFDALPVAAVPWALIRDILPRGVDPRDLATLPRGWRLVRARTAAGDKTMMCFTPEKVLLCRGKNQWPAEAAVALSDMPGKYALLPEELFRPEAAMEEGYHAGLSGENMDDAVLFPAADGRTVLHRRGRSAAQAPDKRGRNAPGGPSAPG